MPDAGKRVPLPREVKALGAVSLLNDASSEMIVPNLPAFLTMLLHAGAATLGIIEGIAETTASLLKYVMGRWSDRLGRRKGLALFGYGLSVLVRPLIGLATSAFHVVALRFGDRVGKGVRTAPRDALVADVVRPEDRARAYGLHRGMDHAGAIAGALIAMALLQWGGLSLRTVFLLSVVPGVLAFLVLALAVHERPRSERADAGVAPAKRDPAPAVVPRPSLLADRRFAGYMLAVLLFTLGNSADAFLVLRALELGIPVALGPVLWVVLHVARSAWAVPGGILADRHGRLRLIVAGWAVYAVAYAGFAAATEAWMMWPLFVMYGLHAGLTEGAERALVAELVGPEARGRAFGVFHLSVGIGALPASLLTGFLWETAGPAAAFGVGAVFAALGALVLLAWPGLPRRAAAAGAGR
ncbi:MAG: MFS transporter [Deltaproteobacteria bacterium]|nr:MFS transporter [Deltaproteobacteria bacterium]